MSKRWQYKVVELPYQMFGGKIRERAKAELDKLGAQGRELVSTVPSHYATALRMFLKKERCAAVRAIVAIHDAAVPAGGATGDGRSGRRRGRGERHPNARPHH